MASSPVPTELADVEAMLPAQPVPAAQIAAPTTEAAASAPQAPASAQPATIDAAAPALIGPAGAGVVAAPAGDTGPATLTPAATMAVAATAQPAGQPAAATTAPTPVPASTPPAAPPPSIQVSARFIERFDGRSQRFEVRLDPAELGKVDIRVEISADKKVHAVIAAHDSASLSDLMKGGKALEAALRDAGIDLADGGLKFEAGGGNSNNGNANANSAGNGNAHGRRGHWDGARVVDVQLEPDLDVTQLQSSVWPAGRLNLVA